MSWWQDVRSDRGTQARTAVALLVLVFWILYAIVQIVAVGALPLFALVLPTDPSDRTITATPFPKFSLCAMDGSAAPNLACQYFRIDEVCRHWAHQCPPHVGIARCERAHDNGAGRSASEQGSLL